MLLILVCITVRSVNVLTAKYLFKILALLFRSGLHVILEHQLMVTRLALICICLTTKTPPYFQVYNHYKCFP